MQFLITGHTGFKGSWLALMLQMNGHSVSGYSLDPDDNSIFVKSDLHKIFDKDVRDDIRNKKQLQQTVKDVNPDVIVHLAAQPLVSRSYLDPVETFDVNVNGTLNLLESSTFAKNLKALLVITTDKVYANINKNSGYIETDKLGGVDPYSASKAAADLITQSWAKNCSDKPIAIARAGNVIGGGDFAENRIIPDLILSISASKPIKLRHPDAIRPWQHVLDCLNGYICLIEKQISAKIGGEWNFGPQLYTNHSVRELVAKFLEYADPEKRIIVEEENSTEFHESKTLILDSSKAREELFWKEKLNFDETVKWTHEWGILSEIHGSNEAMKIQIRNFFEK